MRHPADHPDLEDFSPEEVFAALGNDIRMQTLLAMWRAYDPRADRNVVSFSELYDAVDVNDSGQFNYHLDKLRDRFITRVEDGYAFDPVGLRIVQAIVSGAGQDVDMEARPVDTSCRMCGSDTVLTYENGRVFHVCTGCEGNFDDPRYPDGALWGQVLPPVGLRGREPEDLFALLSFRERPRKSLLTAKICPRCSAEVEHELQVCADHDPGEDGPCATCGYIFEALVEWYCPLCKFHASGSPVGLLPNHPAVAGFLWEHDLSPPYPYKPAAFEELLDYEERNEHLEYDVEIRQSDPPELHVTIAHGEHAISMVVEEDLAVRDVER